MQSIERINLRTGEVTLLDFPTSGGDHLFPVKVEEARLYVFMPEKRQSGTRSVLMLPGGGYNRVALGQCFETARWMTSLGLVCMILEYRLPDGQAGRVLDDLEKAWLYIADNADRWGVDAKRSGLMGYSAGGQLAANWSTLNADSPARRPAFTILLYPVISLLDPAQGGLVQRFLGEKPAQEELRKYSANLHVEKNTPPALILLCDDDQSVQPTHGVVYYSALKEHGISGSLHVFPDGGHAWSMGSGELSGKLFKYAETAMQLTADWLQTLR